jgi:hypothetical protein
MQILLGKKRLSKSTGVVYITCDGYFTTAVRMDDDRSENVPTAILCMYIEPKVISVKALASAETIFVIDIDCRELLTNLALVTNTRIEDKIYTARQFAGLMPYFEIKKYDMHTTPYSAIYERYGLQNCLAEAASTRGEELI